jgi:hypothetical protein
MAPHPRTFGRGKPGRPHCRSLPPRLDSLTVDPPYGGGVASGVGSGTIAPLALRARRSPMPAGHASAPVSSDGHLEVRPERWTPRTGQHRGTRRAIKLPDGGDAILIEGSRPIPFLPRSPGGRTNQDVAAVRGDGQYRRGGPARQRRRQDTDILLAEVLFPNMQVGPRLWRNMPTRTPTARRARTMTGWVRSTARCRAIWSDSASFLDEPEGRAPAPSLRAPRAQRRQPRRVPSGKYIPRPRTTRSGRATHADAAHGARRLRSAGAARLPADVRVPRRRPGDPQKLGAKLLQVDPLPFLNIRPRSAWPSWSCRACSIVCD